MSYEDPSAAHSAGGFYNSKFLCSPLIYVLMLIIFYLYLTHHFCSDYDLRGYKIGVAMAEKSAPRPPTSFGYKSISYLLTICRHGCSYTCAHIFIYEYRMAEARFDLLFTNAFILILQFKSRCHFL